MEEFDAIIVNPNALKNIYQGLSNGVTAIEPPIWASLIAKYLNQKSWRIKLIDCEGLGLTFEQTASELAQLKYKLLVFVVYGQQPSASTQNMYGASRLAKLVKEKYPDSQILMVGGHPAALPEKTLLEEDVDFVCDGEGPKTIEALLSSNLKRTDQLRKIPNLWYFDQGKAVRSLASQQLEKNLDHYLPGMDLTDLPMNAYRAHNWHCFDDLEKRSPYFSMYTSLGCPFKCSFCCINAPFGTNSFRYWTPEFIFNQIKALVEKFGIRNLKIADEMFVLKSSHYLELCKLLSEQDWELNIWAYSRIDTIDPSALTIMRKAGIRWLVLGIESNSTYVRDGVSKGHFGPEQIYQTVQQIREAGIYVHANYIFGLPDETQESMNQTLQLAMSLNTEMANFYCAMAYPGSDLYHMAKVENWELPYNWLGYSQHAKETLPLPSKNLPAREILQFRDEAWQSYFQNPKYLSMLSSTFGESASQHIIDIAKIKLEREILC